MSRKISRSDSIEIFINRRRRTSSNTSSNSIYNDECKSRNSIDSRSMSIGSIGSIESITMEDNDKNDIEYNKNTKQIQINKETKQRTRDVYYELELQPSPNPLYLTHLIIPCKDTMTTTKK